MDRKKRIDAAMGRVKADLVFKNVNVVNVFSEEVVTTDVAVADGCVVGLGSYEGVREVDGTDKFLCPGFMRLILKTIRWQWLNWSRECFIKAMMWCSRMGRR